MRARSVRGSAAVPARGGVPAGRARAEEGRIGLLLLGLLVVLLSLALVIAGASSMYLERKRLLALADAAAAHAASALDAEAYYRGQPGDVPLTDASVRTAAEAFVAGAPPLLRERLTGVHVGEPTGTPDGRTARVTLTARVRPAILPAEMADRLGGANVSVTSTALARR